MEGSSFYNNISGNKKMSSLVSNRFSTLVQSLTGYQRSVIDSVQNGAPLPQNAVVAVGGLVRNGLIAVGTGGTLELTSVGARVALA